MIIYYNSLSTYTCQGVTIKAGKNSLSEKQYALLCKNKGFCDRITKNLITLEESPPKDILEVVIKKKSKRKRKNEA